MLYVWHLTFNFYCSFFKKTKLSNFIKNDILTSVQKIFDINRMMIQKDVSYSTHPPTPKSPVWRPSFELKVEMNTLIQLTVSGLNNGHEKTTPRKFYY